MNTSHIQHVFYMFDQLREQESIEVFIEVVAIVVLLLIFVVSFSYWKRWKVEVTSSILLYTCLNRSFFSRQCIKLFSVI